MSDLLRAASALAVTGLVAAIFVSPKPVFAGDHLAITSGGGAFQQVQRKVLFEPFSKATRINITEDEYDYSASKIRAMVQTKTVSWDVAFVTAGAAIQLCADGVIETLDWKTLGLDRAKFMGADKNDCGLPDSTSATVVTYDKDKLPNGPKTIADLFDLQKYPGKRGLWKGAAINLEWALIADGVAIKDVYKVLNTLAGVDRAFKKLDTIKRDVVWWETGAQPPQLLADAQVIMTAAYNGRIYDAVKNSGKHFEIMWDAAVLNGDSWVIPKGTSRLDQAYKFIAFAGSPRAQADVMNLTAYGPANKDAIALIDPAVLPNLPNAPDHIDNAVLQDPVFWSEKNDELRQRFNAWLAK